MALQKQIVQVPFAKGLRQDVSKKALSGNELLTAINVRMDKDGEVTKRAGVVPIATMPGSEVSNGQLIVAGRRLLSAGAANVYTVAPDTGSLLNIGQVPRVTALREDLLSFFGQFSSVDVAVAGDVVGVLSEAFTDGSNVAMLFRRFSVGEDLSLISSRFLVGGLALRSPRLVAMGSDFYIFYTETGNTLQCIKIDSTGTVSAIQLATAVSLTVVDAGTDGTNLYVVYRGSATNNTHVMKVTSGLVVSSTVTIVDPVATAPKFGIFVLAGALWVSYVRTGTNNVGVRRISTPGVMAVTGALVTATAVAGTSSILSTSLYGDDTTFNLSVSATTSAGYYVAGARGTQSTLTHQTSHNVTYWTSGVGKLFSVDGSIFQLCAVGIEEVSLCLLEMPFVGNTLLRGIAVPHAVTAARFASRHNDEYLSNAPLWDGSTYLSMGTIRNDNAGRVGATLLRFNFSDRLNLISFQADGIAYTAGGLPCRTAGLDFAELGFLYRPKIISVTPNVTGTGLPAGDYSYKAIFFFCDSSGNIEWSAESDAVVGTLGGIGNFAVTVSAYSTTRKQSAVPVSLGGIGNVGHRVLVVLYRTKINTDMPYFRVFDSDAQTVNSLLTETVTITDSTADATIATHPAPYTAGGVLNNTPPPATAQGIAWRNRIAFLGDDGKHLFISRSVVNGEVAALSDVIVVGVPSSRRLRDLAVLDDKLVMFSRKDIFVLSGEGPTDTGLPPFESPVRVATDFGCIEPRSILSIRDGVFYQSPVGLYFLDRAMQVSNIGSPVQDTLDQYPTITSAYVDPASECAVFTCCNDEDGVRVVYDYQHRQWFTDEIYASSTAMQRIFSSVELEGTVYMLDAAGSILREDPSTYLDDGTWVTQDVEMANLRSGGANGWQRVWHIGLLGERQSAHDLLIRVAVEDRDTYDYTYTFTNDRLEAFSDQTLRVFPNVRGRALRVRITDSAPSSGSIGTGQGMTLQSLALVVGVKPGLVPRPVYHRGG